MNLLLSMSKNIICQIQLSKISWLRLGFQQFFHVEKVSVPFVWILLAWYLLSCCLNVKMVLLQPPLTLAQYLFYFIIFYLIFSLFPFVDWSCFNLLSREVSDRRRNLQPCIGLDPLKENEKRLDIRIFESSSKKLMTSYICRNMSHRDTVSAFIRIHF